MTNFTDEMDKLAAQIAKSLYGDIALGDKIDGFKALTPYYVWQMKNAGKSPEEGDLPDFDKFAEAIHGTETANGSDEPGVRDRRRNGN